MMKFCKKKVVVTLVVALFLGGLGLHASPEHKADLVIFSYDRPLQLYAFLQSLEVHVTGLASTNVIYRSSDNEFDKGYKVVRDTFKNVRFTKQGPKAPADFKQKLLKVAFGDAQAEYILFGVDDLIMTDFVDVAKCIEQMEKNKAYGFYLRLGKNITECYTITIQFDLPELKSVGDRMLTWHFNKAEGDWSLAATTDMTIYRKKDLRSAFESLEYKTPNTFEARWISYERRKKDEKQLGLCFDYSKVVNIPFNIVQEMKTHRNMNFLLPAELNKQFLRGNRIDITSVSTKQNGGVPINKAPHMEFIPRFIGTK